MQVGVAGGGRGVGVGGGGGWEGGGGGGWEKSSKDSSSTEFPIQAQTRNPKTEAPRRTLEF